MRSGDACELSSTCQDRTFTDDIGKAYCINAVKSNLLLSAVRRADRRNVGTQFDRLYNHTQVNETMRGSLSKRTW